MILIKRSLRSLVLFDREDRYDQRVGAILQKCSKLIIRFIEVLYNKVCYIIDDWPCEMLNSKPNVFVLKFMLFTVELRVILDGLIDILPKEKVRAL